MRLMIIPVILSAAFCFADAPSYEPFVYMYSGGSPIDVGYYGAPCIADWNGDGNKDMVIGIFSYGNIWFYANDNTNDSPVFNSYSALQADGVPIALPYG